MILHNSKLLRGWVGNVAPIYSIPFNQVIHSVEVSGTQLTQYLSYGALLAGGWFHDVLAGVLYVWTSDSANPNSKFIVVESKMFFSNVSVHAPHDMSTGYDVVYRPLLKGTSQFGVELDNQNQFGLAIEGSGSIDLINDAEFWSQIFDKVTFENKRCYVYSWSRTLPVSEAKLIYKGIVERKSWSPQTITFRLKDSINEIRALVPVSDMGDVVGRVSEKNRLKKQRTIYGTVYGHVPTSIDDLIGGTYPLTGTATIVTASATVTGTGTAFLAEVSPGDSLTFSVDADRIEYTVKEVTSDTVLTLTEEYEGFPGSGTVELRPDRPKRWQNREWKIAGHALRQPTTAVTASGSLAWIDVVSTLDLMPGDVITVGAETTNVGHISGNRIFMTPFLELPASVGAVVTRLSVSAAYIGRDRLVYSRDYTVNASTAQLTLTDLAEFNIAKVRAVTGTVTLTNASRSVTGTNTIFDQELKPSDWIRAQGEADYFEVLSVDSPTSLTLRTPATYSLTVAARYKSPAYIGDGSVILSVDCLGKTVDGLTSGALISTAPAAVKDVLTSVGVSASEIDTASFSTASELAYQRIGLVVPEKEADKKSQVARDVINKVNRSVFGSLVQTNDFKLKYNILEPKRSSTVLELSEKDVVAFKITSDASRVVSNVKVNYLKREYDYLTLAASYSQESKSSDQGTYLVKTSKEYEHESNLIDSTDAQLLANRFSFFFSQASAEIALDTKMIAARSEVNDRVTLTHEKMFERIGSNDKRKTAAIQSVQKTVFDTSIGLDDLANSFTRCGVITSNIHPTWALSTNAQKTDAGYITDSYGMISNDPDTFGINLIW